MHIEVEGRQPLHGNYQVSGNGNAAMALIAASMLTDAAITLTNVPDTVSVSVMLEIGVKLGMWIERDAEKLVLRTAEIRANGLDREQTDALSGTVGFLAPIRARRQRAYMVIEYGLSRLNPHLTALRDLGLNTTIQGNVMELNAGPWERREIVLTETRG